MIILQATNSNPMSGSGIACNLGATVINTSTPIGELVDFCICDYECEYEEKAFVNLGDATKEYENDKKDVLVQLPDENGTVFFFLLNEKTSQEIPLIDDTYGTFYPLGFNSNNANQSGYLLDWNKVVTLLGHGTFKIKSKITSFGVTGDATTYRYRTCNYSDENANGTVRIKTIHNGYIENGIDYTGLNWTRYVRSKGKLKGFNPIPENERYNDITRKSRQIQTNVITEHELRIDLVPEQFFKSLFYDRLLADEIYISDYNLFNPLQKIRDLSVEWTENNSITEYPMNTKLSLSIKLTEVDRSTLKRFYR